MVNYDFFKKWQIAIYPLPVCLSNIDATYFRFKNGDIRGDRIFAVKSQFGYLNNFLVVSNKNVSNSYHF